MGLLLKRGTDADRQLYTPSEGELIYTTDTKKVYVGDGSTVGGNIVESPQGGGTTVNLATSSIGDLGDVSTSGSGHTPSDGQALVWNASHGHWMPGTVATSGGTTITRGSVSHTTASIAADATENATLTAAKSYGVISVTTDKAAWVRIYSDIASRNADASRAITQDPDPDAGVNAEVITTSGTTVRFTPAMIGWNDESTPLSEMYLAITNKSGSTNTIAVTVNYIPLES